GIFFPGPSRHFNCKELLDTCEPESALIGRIALRGYQSPNRAKRTRPLVQTARQELWDRRDGPFLVKTNQQGLLAKCLFQLAHRPCPAGGLSVMDFLENGEVALVCPAFPLEDVNG